MTDRLFDNHKGIALLLILVLSSCMPDLRVDNLSHSPECPSTADEITFTATVINAGNKTAGSSVLSLKVGGESNASVFPIPALGPGKTHIVQRQQVLGAAQYYQNTAIADSNSQVEESDEGNNQRIEQYAVGDPNCKPKCMTVPKEDSQSPSLALSITYKHFLGMMITDTVNTTDHNTPITVVVLSGEPFTMMAASFDDGGVKNMSLPWEYHNNMNQVVQPLIAPWDYSSCAQKSHIATSNFNGSSGRIYRIYATATDFHDNTSTTPEITVKQGW